MATRVVKTGEPKDVLAYLNSFPNDPLQYIIDPEDPRQVIVENQKIFETSSNTHLNIGTVFSISLPSIEKTSVCKVVAQSLWNPSLILVEGNQVHLLKDGITVTLNQPKKNSKAKSNKQITSRASNIITIISDVEPLDQGAKPTRNSPDDNFQTPPPTRNSDGTRIPDPTRNSPDGNRLAACNEENIPLTEYWLQRALIHNNEHQGRPIVAIMDTGIDFRYDWTMGHERLTTDQRLEIAPHCPLWFNTETTNTELGYDPQDINKDTIRTKPILQKDYIGWNFVGIGRLYSNQHPNPYDDDSANKHGTRIAAIIAQQTDWQVRLMILKTHDYRGVGPLFNILCACDYLLQHSHGLKIVNASWGYYGSCNFYFKERIRELNAKGIYFVNAAGNQTDFYDDYHGHELKKSTPTERYPACFSGPPFTMDKVITVTTIKNRLRFQMYPPQNSIDYNFKTVENYSNVYVNVAVGSGRNGTFPEPLAESNDTIKGSSYATAYVSGRLASNINRNPNNPEALDYLWNINPQLSSTIKGGNFLFIDMDFISEAY